MDRLKKGNDLTIIPPERISDEERERQQSELQLVLEQLRSEREEKEARDKYWSERKKKPFKPGSKRT